MSKAGHGKILRSISKRIFKILNNNKLKTHKHGFPIFGLKMKPLMEGRALYQPNIRISIPVSLKPTTQHRLQKTPNYNTFVRKKKKEINNFLMGKKEINNREK